MSNFFMLVFGPDVLWKIGSPKIKKNAWLGARSWPRNKKASLFEEEGFGVEDGARTRDPRYHKPML